MDLSGMQYLPIKRIMERGTAEIIEQSEDVLFIRDGIRGVSLLACEDDKLAEEVMERHKDCGIRVLSTTSRAAAEYAAEKLGFSDMSECYQYVYLGERPEEDGKLRFRTADPGDLDTIIEVYDLGGREDILKTIESGLVRMAYSSDGELVGFVGEHREGSLGMLFIFPEHRRKGYGLSLELEGIRRFLDRGLVPYGQVYIDNLPSVELQKKVGMTLCEKPVYWTHKAE